MKKHLHGVMAVAMLLIVGLIAPASAVVAPGGDFGQCDGLEWIKYDWGGGTWVEDSSTEAPDAAITLDATLDQDNEPVSVDWTSDPAAASVHVGAAVGGPGGHAAFDGGTSGTVTGIGKYAISHIIFCFPAPVVEPDLQTLTINKVWEGALGPSPDVDVTFEVQIGEETFTLDEGVETQLPAGTIESVAETLVGFPDSTCDYEASWITEDNVLTLINDVECDEPNFDITITLVKEWFDYEGNHITEPDGLTWSVDLFVTEDDVDVVKASLPGSGSFIFERDAEDETVVYGVTEPSIDGYQTVPCDTVRAEEIGRDFEDTSTIKAEANPEVGGAFTTTLGGVHLVCNQELPPDDDVETVDISLFKLWMDEDSGFDIDAPEDLDFAITLSVDGEVLITLDEVLFENQPYVSLEVGTDYVIEEVIEPAGWTLTECPDEVLDSDNVHGVDTGTFSVDDVGGRHFVCNQQIQPPDDDDTTPTTPTTPTTEPTAPEQTPTDPIDEVEVLPAPPVEADPVEEPEPVTPDPEVTEPEVAEPEAEVTEPVAEVTEPEAEVLGETLTRTTPTRIDSGTGGSLDNSGLLALLIMGGLALSGFGITSAATVRRRR